MPEAIPTDAELGNSGTSHHREESDALHKDNPILFTADGVLSPRYLTGLADCASQSNNEDLSNPCGLFYSRLRLYNMQHIAQELNYLRTKALVTKDISREELNRLRILLHEQVLAMKDIEYINEHLEPVSEERFCGTLDQVRSHNLSVSAPSVGWFYAFPRAHTATSRLMALLTTLLPRQIIWSSAEKKRQPHYYSNGMPPSETSTAVRIIASLIISLASAATIIVPMIVMSFDGGKTKSLVTISVAVLLFGFVLAAVIQVRSENVFLATATYAAVLVVFVGTNGAAGSG